MTVKTIKRNLENKITEWLDSITDKELSKELKNNILVSGGSIASMFIGEKINDYDIYIKNIDVLLSLCKYYTQKYGIIDVLDGREKQKIMDEELTTYAQKSEDIQFAFKVALTNLKEDQIKLWFDGAAGMFKPEHEPGKVLHYEPIFFSPNAISLSNDMQIVIRFNGDHEQIHKNFDFIHATNYFTLKDGLVTNKEALESILTKQLKYTGSLYPLTSVIRMRKFIKRGWNINAGEILKILMQVSELNLKDPNVLEEQLIGIDIAYFGKLISVLRGVEPDKLTTEYISKIIDKVFNETEESEDKK